MNSVRPWSSPADYDVMAEVANRAAIADGSHRTWGVDDMRSLFEGVEGLRPETSVTIAEAGGAVVGFSLGQWLMERDDQQILWTRCRDVPEWLGQGIGKSLLRAAQSAAHTHANTLGRHERRRFQTRLADADARGLQLLLRDGYEEVRRFVHMIRPTLHDLPDAPLPTGVDIRPVGADDRMKILVVFDQAFREEWYYGGSTEAELRASLEDRLEGQTRHWQVAWAGDEVIGGVLGHVDDLENSTYGRRRGYPERVFTRADWRGRGLARGLVVAELRHFAEEGLVEAGLIADPGSASRAVALYQRIGFENDWFELVVERRAG